MLTDNLSSALVGAGSAVLGSLITGLATVRMARIGFSQKRTRKLLRLVLKDLEYYIALEQEYLNQLSGERQTTEASVKLAVRDAVRTKLGRSLSKRSEPARLRELLRTNDETD